MLKQSTAAHDLVVDLRELRQADLESRIEQDASLGDWRVFAICTAIALLDGFDVQTMGVAAPALTRAWGVAPAAMSTVFAAAPAGMLVGALVMGRLADRFGRRCPIIVATLLFAVGTGLTAFAPNLTALAAIRFLTGLGLGGVLPNLVSLVTESAPAAAARTADHAHLLDVSAGRDGRGAPRALPHSGIRLAVALLRGRCGAPDRRDRGDVSAAGIDRFSRTWKTHAQRIQSRFDESIASAR